MGFTVFNKSDLELERMLVIDMNSRGIVDKIRSVGFGFIASCIIFSAIITFGSLHILEDDDYMDPSCYEIQQGVIKNG